MRPLDTSYQHDLIIFLYPFPINMINEIICRLVHLDSYWFSYPRVSRACPPLLIETQALSGCRTIHQTILVNNHVQHHTISDWLSPPFSLTKSDLNWLDMALCVVHGLNLCLVAINRLVYIIRAWLVHPICHLRMVINGSVHAWLDKYPPLSCQEGANYRLHRYLYWAYADLLESY